MRLLSTTSLHVSVTHLSKSPICQGNNLPGDWWDEGEADQDASSPYAALLTTQHVAQRVQGAEHHCTPHQTPGHRRK